MIWQIDLWLLILLSATALLALEVRSLLAAVALLAAYSFFIAVVFAQLGAIDVAFIEATLGAGVSGVLFVVTLFCVGRGNRK